MLFFQAIRRNMASLVRKEAPQFSLKALVNGEITTIKRDDMLGKYWVLFFYPLNFTFVCPTEINAFNDRLNDFKAAGCEVLGASVDSEYAHLAWTRLPRNEGGLGPTHLPLLADTTHALAKAFGVHLDEAGVALRGLFIMDPKAIVRHATVNDLGIGRSVDETLRVLQAIQFTDKHGEVCPAGWQQGSPTIKPNPEESRIYFARLSAAASQ